MAWTSETGVAQFQLILLCVTYEKCLNVYAPSDTSVNNIYMTEMQVATFDVAKESTFHSHYGIAPVSVV